MRIHIYSMAVKGVYEISVSVGNKVRMFGRDFSLFIVRGDVGGTVNRRGCGIVMATLSSIVLHRR